MLEFWVSIVAVVGLFIIAALKILALDPHKAMKQPAGSVVPYRELEVLYERAVGEEPTD